MSTARIDAIVRRYTDFTNLDAMIATYAEKQLEAMCLLPEPKCPEQVPELLELERTLNERGIRALAQGMPEQTEVDNPIPEKPFTARDAAIEIWKDLDDRSGFGLGSLKYDDEEIYEEIIGSMTSIIEKVNAPHS